MCSPKAKAKIIEVQSFDSPGFTEDFVNSPDYLETESKILKFVPEESMIGMLLNDTASYRIVKSDGEGIHQHDPFLWLVEDNDFITGEKIHTKAKFVNSTFREWVGNFTPEQRELFVDAMFDIVEATNVQKAESFVDWSENLRGNTSLILDTIKEFTTLGSGYKIAMRDLSIRGAGDILGSEQSGFIDDIGINLYMKLLNEAIEEEKGIIKKQETEKVVDLKISKHIDEKNIYTVDSTNEAFALVNKLSFNKEAYVLIENDLPDLFNE